ncbi:aldehyde dehydrogenase [Caldalkalibacillus thermarum]|uniref:acetaldehyde dehydrogenase (acetylating) n=1 Tax=Caldalkalibacillus thermarum TaxID=296745 RepID=UPI0016680224|nr:acetaldehyde dehydrogenase (acetylating) [Caldalkalibacillus thermarum]GGK29721.1 aldehyde dehydrogenase [Caldalkalibacillus thermarum]
MTAIIEWDKDLRSVQEMRLAVAKAKEAQHIFAGFSQQQVDRIVKAMADAAFEQASKLAHMAVEETGLGVYEHKVIKNQVAARDVYESIRDVKTVGIVNENREEQIVEVASPFGVIAGIVPTTNPTSTAIFKSLIGVKARNAIVFSPHPAAAKCTVEAARVCMQAAREAGAPDGLIGWITEPTMEATEGLMKHPDVHLILATGGSGLVKAAYSSGKPAYGVGPGNAPVYIERSADISQSVKRIVDSKTFDNGTICASEQAVIVDQQVRHLVVHQFKNNGAYFLNEAEKKKVEAVMTLAPGKLNPKIVGKSATVIAQMAGITVPEKTRLLIAEETEVGKHIPFSIEKLSPLFAFYSVRDWQEAVDLCKQLLALGGRGHTLAIHTRDDGVARRFAEEIPVSRIVVNTPAALGAVGATTHLKPSYTLGCGTFGGNITSDNITVHHLINLKRMAYGIRDIDIPRPGTDSLPERRGEKGWHNKAVEVQQVVEKVLVEEGKVGRVDKEMVTQLVQEVLAKLG